MPDLRHPLAGEPSRVPGRSDAAAGPRVRAAARHRRSAAHRRGAAGGAATAHTNPGPHTNSDPRANSGPRADAPAAEPGDLVEGPRGRRDAAAVADDAHSYSHSHPHADADAHTDADPNAEADPDPDSGADSDSDTDPDTNTHTNAETTRPADADADTDADAGCDGHTDGRGATCQGEAGAADHRGDLGRPRGRDRPPAARPGGGRGGRHRARRADRDRFHLAVIGTDVVP